MKLGVMVMKSRRRSRMSYGDYNKCQLCGCEGTEENPVTSGPDPFNHEIRGDDTPRDLCAACRRARSEDI